MGVDPSPAGIYEDSVLVPDAAPPEPEETAPEVRFGGLFSRRDRKKKKTRIPTSTTIVCRLTRLRHSRRRRKSYGYGTNSRSLSFITRY
jgi:hypothetical protein